MRTATSLAASVECLHNASLIQDDLQDKSLIRRNQATVVAKFGENVALGLTNRLVTTSFACIDLDENPHAHADVIHCLHRAVATTVDGQTGELVQQHGWVSVAKLLHSARQKSGPLFALSLELPLLAAGHHRHLTAANNAASEFGLGYQILDDLRDYYQDSASSKGVNIVKAICNENDCTVSEAQTQAVQIGKQILTNAAKLASTLPSQSGNPLLDLVNQHLPLLDELQ